MSDFTAKKLKEARIKSNLSQEEVAKVLKITDRKLRSIESNQHPLLVDDLMNLTRLYKIDIREVLFESYTDESEEQILCNRYGKFVCLFDQLSDKDKEDIVWVVKQRVSGRI